MHYIFKFILLSVLVVYSALGSSPSIPTPPTPAPASSEEKKTLLQPLLPTEKTLKLNNQDVSMMKGMQRRWEGMDTPFIYSKVKGFENNVMGPFVKPPRGQPPPIFHLYNAKHNGRPWNMEQPDDKRGITHTYVIRGERSIGKGPLPRWIDRRFVPPIDTDVNANPWPYAQAPMKVSNIPDASPRPELLDSQLANDLAVHAERAKDNEIRAFAQDITLPQFPDSKKGPVDATATNIPENGGPIIGKYVKRTTLDKANYLTIKNPAVVHRIKWPDQRPIPKSMLRPPTPD